MAWSIQLENSATSLNLNDGTAFKVLMGGVDAPSPALRTTFAGQGNLFRSGSRLIKQAYENRTVTLSLQVFGSSSDTLATNVELLEAFLRRAHEFSTFGLGSQVKLKYQWDSATNPVYFHVITGTFEPITAAQHGPMLQVNKDLINASLTLLCEPFAFGAQETIQNYVRNPSFEIAGTALADWTQNIDATGATARDTTNAKYGNANLKLTMTNSGGSGQVVERTQTLADVDAAEVWSFGAWVHLTALSNSKAGLVLLYNDGSATTTTSYRTTTTSDWTLLSLENQTVPSGAGQVIVKLRLESTAGSATGTCFFDAVTAVQATSLPTAFASSYEIANNLEDSGQLFTNYLDIYNVPGEVPATLQVYATENENHTKFWMGARQAGRLSDDVYFENSDFDTFQLTTTDADSSSNSYGETHFYPVKNATSNGTETSDDDSVTLAHTVQSTYGNRMILVWVANHDSGSGAVAPSSVTYAGDACTKIVDETDVNRSTSLWYRVAPDTGNNNVVVTWGSAQNNKIVSATDYYGVDQSSPIRGSTDANGTATSASASQTSVRGDIVVALLAHSVATASAPAAGETELFDQTASSNLHMAGYQRYATGTSTTMAPTWSGSSGYYLITAAIQSATGVTSTASTPVVLSESVTTPPRGLFRVLARVNEQGSSADVRLSMGFSQGAVTSDPSVAADYIALDGSNFHIADLGTVTIPIFGVPENTDAGAFTLRINAYDAQTTPSDSSIRLDWVMLMPIDLGSMYVSKSAATDTVLVDSISDLRAAVLLNASDVVQSIPATQGGDPPTVHPEGTRLYFASDNGAADIADGWKVKVTVQPRFLSVAGT